MSGLRYRLSMRLAHRLGYCKPAETGPLEEGGKGYVWCHWCGMRGYLPSKDPVPAKWRFDEDIRAYSVPLPKELVEHVYEGKGWHR